MRFLHTADWHLGRSLAGYPLIEDQAFILDQIIDIASTESVDAVIIAGDLYDRAVPPPDAVELLDDALCRLSDAAGTVIAISGNHDSPRRLGFGARLMAARGVHLITGIQPQRIEIADREVIALAYCEPAHAREVLGDQTIHDHGQAILGLLDHSGLELHGRIFTGHLFLGGGEVSQSERPLSIGGSELVPSSVLEPFAYSALGHLHRPQNHLEGRARYSGSILPYSLSEAGQTKSVTLVDLGGDLQVSTIDLAPRRQLRRIEGLFNELQELPGSDDYIHVVLADPRPVLDPVSRLRERFPNLLSLERPNYAPAAKQAPVIDPKRGWSELFDDFFSQTAGRAMDGEEKAAFAQAYDAWRAQAREAGA